MDVLGLFGCINSFPCAIGSLDEVRVSHRPEHNQVDLAVKQRSQVLPLSEILIRPGDFLRPPKLDNEIEVAFAGDIFVRRSRAEKLKPTHIVLEAESFEGKGLFFGETKHVEHF